MIYKSSFLCMIATLFVTLSLQAMQTAHMHPVSLKLQMFCKFLEEDAFHEEVAKLKKEYTFEEKIALQVPDEQFAKLHNTWARSSLRVLTLKYPDNDKNN